MSVVLYVVCLGLQQVFADMSLPWTWTVSTKVSITEMDVVIEL